MRVRSLASLIQSEAEKPIRDVQARGSERSQRVAHGRYGSDAMACQNQADGADARNSQSGRLAACGMIVEYHLRAWMTQGHGQDSGIAGVEISPSENSGNRRRGNHAQPIRDGFRHQGDRGIAGLPLQDLVQNGTRREDLDVRSWLA